MYRKEKNEKDVLYILEHLRDEDRHEAITQSGQDFIEKTLKEIMELKGNYVMGCTKADDTPVCIGGCEPSDVEGIGVVWLLSTPEIANHQMIVLKNIKQELQQYEKQYLILFNTIFVENYMAKKWLSKFGFKFENFLNLKIPNDHEFFYKKRNMRGLNNADSTSIS